jgi:signal transduction histidine kinase
MLLQTAGWRHAVTPFGISTGLLFLVIVRQTMLFTEHEQLRQEQATARATIGALEEVNRRMEAFLGVASHELKTPLTSLQGNVEMLVYRLSSARRHDAEATDHVSLFD